MHQPSDEDKSWEIYHGPTPNPRWCDQFVFNLRISAAGAGLNCPWLPWLLRTLSSPPQVGTSTQARESISTKIRFIVRLYIYIIQHGLYIMYIMIVYTHMCTIYTYIRIYIYIYIHTYIIHIYNTYPLSSLERHSISLHLRREVAKESRCRTEVKVRILEVAAATHHVGLGQCLT